MKKTILLIALASLTIANSQAQPTGGLPALQNQIATLTDQVNALTTQVTGLQTTISGLQSQITANNQHPVFDLDSYVSVGSEPFGGGASITFSGANIHIVNGSGSTTSNPINGVGSGNLIIGYNENFGSNIRGGSHNLILGVNNSYARTAFAGIVTGQNNTINNAGDCIIGGSGNNINFGFGHLGVSSVILGGQNNIVVGNDAVVLGGGSNQANGNFSVVLGGFGIQTPFTDYAIAQ